MKHIFTILLSIILLGTSPMCALAQEAYAIISPNNRTLAFYYDNQKASRKGTAYEFDKKNRVDEDDKNIRVDEDEQNVMAIDSYGIVGGIGMMGYKSKGPRIEIITTVIFDESFKNARPVSCNHWFANFLSLKKILGINNLNTSNVTDMSYMFWNCKSLTEIDLNNFDTSKVKDMKWMFGGCKSLTTLDVSKFNTSKVSDMEGLFAGCSNLTNLDLDNFDTSNATKMANMFCECGNLTHLNVSHFKTSNVTDMYSMFRYCKSLKTLDVSSFKTSKVKYMSDMFIYCKELKTIYAGKGWATSKVECSLGMFDNCPNLVGGKGTTFDSEVIDITRAKIDGGKTNPGYFTAKGKSSARTLTQEAYASCAISSSGMARTTHTLTQEAYAIVSPDMMSPDKTTLTFYYDNKKASRKGTAYEIDAEGSIPKWVNWLKHGGNSYPVNPDFKTVVFDESCKDARPVSCRCWFAGFYNLTKIEGISNLNTSNVTDMSRMFDDCKSLTTIDVSKFNTSKVTDMCKMFNGCRELTTLDVRNFDTSNVTDMTEMFNGCWILTTLDLSNFNTSKVTNMKGMFRHCQCLANINMRNFNTSNVTDISGMFSDCGKLTYLDVNKFDTSNVTNMSYMFWNCNSLTEIDLNNFDTSKVTDMNCTFENCKNLKTIYVGKGWNTSNVKESKEMFRNCPNLIGGKGTKFNPEVIDKNRAIIDGGKANPGYLTAKK